MAKNKIVLHMVNGETLEVTATPELDHSLARLAAGYLPPSTFLKADGFHVNTANVLMFEGLTDQADETQRASGGRVYEAATNDPGYQLGQTGGVVTAEPEAISRARDRGGLEELPEGGGDMPEGDDGL